MEHFLVKPNYSTLSRYYQFDQSEEEFEQINAEGYPIVIDAYLNSRNEWKFTGDHIQEVEEDFKEILRRYRLEEHYHNLMFLILTKRAEIDAVLFHNHDTYVFKKRAKELAQLLLAFKRTEERHLVGISLKTFTETIKITDKKLVSWIGSVIQTALASGEVPAHVLGLEDWSIDSVEDLQRLANQRIPLQDVTYRKTLADFCIKLYPYLINETSIRPNPQTLFPDDMLNFFFNTVVLLDMLNPDEIGSDGKDYMRSVLQNQINRINN